MDQLNDDIRRLTQENKEAFTRRMKLEAEKNKLENLLTNNLHRRKDELMQVRHSFYPAFYSILSKYQPHLELIFIPFSFLIYSSAGNNYKEQLSFKSTFY